jgi:hypothetical protein
MTRTQGELLGDDSPDETPEERAGFLGRLATRSRSPGAR